MKSAIVVKYHGPTVHRPSRLIATTCEGDHCVLSYQEAQDRAGNKTIFDDSPYREAANALCALVGRDTNLIGAQLDKDSWVYVNKEP